MGHWLLNASVFLWTIQPVILLVAQDLPLFASLFCYTGSMINTINILCSDIAKISLDPGICPGIF